MKMDFDAMLRAVLEQVRAAGIPAAAQIDPHVRLNTRAKKRYGRCICKNGRYEIELSAHLVHAESPFVYAVLAHEVLHTCPGCMNHGPLWKQYAARMGSDTDIRLRARRSMRWCLRRRAKRRTFCNARPAARCFRGSG